MTKHVVKMLRGTPATATEMRYGRPTNVAVHSRDCTFEVDGVQKNARVTAVPVYAGDHCAYINRRFHWDDPEVRKHPDDQAIRLLCIEAMNEHGY
jgi:hypothetical protein